MNDERPVICTKVTAYYEDQDHEVELIASDNPQLARRVAGGILALRELRIREMDDEVLAELYREVTIDIIRTLSNAGVFDGYCEKEQ